MNPVHPRRWRRVAVAVAVLVAAGSVSVGTALAEPTPMPPSLAPVAGSLGEFLAGSPVGLSLVMVHGADMAAAEDAVAETGMVRLSNFESIDVVVAQATPRQIEAARAEPGVTYIEDDQVLRLMTDTSHEATRGAEAVRTLTGADGNPLDGSGVSIAVLDSGIDPNHPSLAGQVGVSLFCDPLNTVICETVPLSVPSDLTLEGHGTAVSATALGNPVTTPGGPEVVGAAPGATLVSLGVSIPNGPPGGISLIAASAALEWVLDNHADPCGDGSCPGIKVTNNSYGPVGGGAFDPNAAVTLLQQALVDEGVMSVWANGNDGGDGDVNLSNPAGQDPTAGIVSVASHFDFNVADRDTPDAANVSSFSSRGSAADSSTWPDISAPGEEILTACPVLFRICSLGQNTTGFDVVNGTSFAAPHIAGIIAQLFQLAPDATPAEVEDALKATAFKYDDGEPVPYVPLAQYTSSFDKGTGLVDVIAAAEALAPGVGTDPGGDDAGHGEDKARYDKDK